MSYFGVERSEYEGQPIELYRFVMGTDVWTYTNAASIQQYNGEDYTPMYIDRGGYTKSGDTSKSNTEIKLSASDPLALVFRTGWLTSTMILTVYRHHQNDPDYMVIWKGRVTGCKWEGSTATLTTDSVFTTFKRAGLRRMYQVGCPHVLYGPLCGVNPNTYKVLSTVSLVSGENVTVSGIGGYASGYFTGGKIKCGLELRMIINHVGSVITMVGPMEAIAVSSSVELYPGCPHDVNACSSKFNNIVNYGGLPFLPTKNPFSGDALV